MKGDYVTLDTRIGTQLWVVMKSWRGAITILLRTDLGGTVEVDLDGEKAQALHDNHHPLFKRIRHDEISQYLGK